MMMFFYLYLVNLMLDFIVLGGFVPASNPAYAVSLIHECHPNPHGFDPNMFAFGHIVSGSWLSTLASYVLSAGV